MAGHGMRDIKRSIKSIHSIEKITNAMELVSTVKLRKTRKALDQNRKLHDQIEDMLAEMIPYLSDVESIYLKNHTNHKSKGPEPRSCYIVITSSKGLCGSFNTNIMKSTLAKIMGQTSPLLVTFGNKGKEFFAKRHFHALLHENSPLESIGSTEIKPIIGQILSLYHAKEIGALYLSYSKFNGLSSQKPVTVKLLPIAIPSKKAGARKHSDFNPCPAAVLNHTIPKYLELKLLNGIAESSVCEHSARRIAMENAKENADRLKGKLVQSYNRARQAAITQEIAEIVSGAEALR